MSLSLWANAWLAGKAAPDDVLDALTAWAPTHSVTAYDAVAAGRTGLPWPDVDDAGTMSLLQTVRTACGPRGSDGWPRRPAMALLFPVPGDVRGLPAGTQFASDALDAGEALVITDTDGGAIGLVPAAESADDEAPLPHTTLLWSVYSLQGAPAGDHVDLGDAEYALRSAVRSAAEALDGLKLVAGQDDPRELVEEVLQANGHHQIPDHAPARAVRVLSTAAHVDAIITVTSGVAPISTQSASQSRIADTALRPLSAVVRTARSAAVGAILQSAWQ